MHLNLSHGLGSALSHSVCMRCHSVSEVPRCVHEGDDVDNDATSSPADSITGATLNSCEQGCSMSKARPPPQHHTHACAIVSDFVL